MKERPILFCTALVPEILADRKTVTRRLVRTPFVVDEHPVTGQPWPLHPSYVNGGDDEGEPLACPFGAPGDRLWVREAFRASASDPKAIHYSASVSEYERREKGPWKPSIHMPRWACRLTLDVVSVRVERLQDITADDVIAEGIKLPATDHDCPPGKVIPLVRIGSPYLKAHPDVKCWKASDFWLSQFACTWDDINAKRAPWDSNPWVWRIEFKRVEESHVRA